MSTPTRTYIIETTTDGETHQHVKEVSTAAPVPQNVVHRCEEISRKETKKLPFPMFIENGIVKRESYFSKQDLVQIRPATINDYLTLKILAK